jgi:2-polyprenyl-3-methyl-5-hydroxy-6-metoxy-1,4-benzoquinol methylase
VSVWPREERLAAPVPAPGEFNYESIPPGYYDQIYGRRAGVQSKWHHLKFRRVMEEMRDLTHHLDVGCGPGTLIGALGDEYVSLGVDVSHNQIAHARRTYDGATTRFFAGPLSQLPDHHRDFDVATVIEVVEHLRPETVDLLLRETVRRLRSGGKLILTTPNFQGAWPLIEAMVNRFGEVEYRTQHINKFTPALLRSLLEALGLRNVQVRPYLVVAPFAAALGWRTADLVERLERRLLERHLGLILLGTGTKP